MAWHVVMWQVGMLHATLGSMLCAGNTEYRAEFPAKEAEPRLPPLTGLRAPVGLQLPFPRRSLGVEFWHRGQTNQ